MKKLFIFLLPVLLMTHFACKSQVATKADATAKTKSYAPTKAENALLWEISGKDLAAPSYLYGTIHMIDKKDFFLTDKTKENFAKSKHVVFEMDMEEMSNPMLIFSMMNKIMMPDGQTLKDLLPDEDYQFVRKKFEEMGMPGMMTNMLEKMKPLFLTAMSEDMMPGSMNEGKVVSYELELMKMAQKDKKTMGGLETIEFQMSVFDSIPYKVQAEMLVDGLRAEGDGEGSLQQLVEIYKAQDIVGMQDQFSAEEGGLEGYEDVLLVKRNQNWIPIMEGLMKEKVTFFAVGAGHLAGEQGVIALLRMEGYDLKPLRDPKK